MNPSQAGRRLFCVVVIKNSGAACSALIYSFPLLCLITVCLSIPVDPIPASDTAQHYTRVLCTVV